MCSAECVTKDNISCRLNNTYSYSIRRRDITHQQVVYESIESTKESQTQSFSSTDLNYLDELKRIGMSMLSTIYKHSNCLKKLASVSAGSISSGRSIQTACTVHHDSLTQAVKLAIQESSAPHHGFTSSDMPSHAFVLISRHYFPEEESHGSFANTIHSTITESLGNNNIDIIGAVVDEIHDRNTGTLKTGHASPRGVSLFLASEDERASIHVFEDKVDRNISLGRAWKSQGKDDNAETIDDSWIPSGDWKTLLGGTKQSAPSDTLHIAPLNDVKSAFVIGKGDFSAMDWPAQLFPMAKKYGITAAITPFLTGYPITMMHNKKLLHSGGIAMGFSKDLTGVKVTQPFLKVLGEPLSVTK